MGEQYCQPGGFGDSGVPRQIVTIPETMGRFQGPEERHKSPERLGALQMPDEGPFPPGEATAPLDPGNLWPGRPSGTWPGVTFLPRMEHCSPKRPRAASRTRPFPGSYLKPAVKVGRPPPLWVPALELRALPTPLAEVQGDFSLQLNQRINRGFVPQTRWWVPGSPKAGVGVTVGAGPGEVMAAAPRQLQTTH